MPTVKLTDSAIRKALAAAVDGKRPEITDSNTPGLRFRAGRDGRHGVWSLMVRDNAGRNRRVGLGQYPTIRIAAAREAASKALHRIRHEGADPTAERRAARDKAAAEQAEAEKPPEMTLWQVFELWSRQTGAKEEKSYRDRRNRIRSVFPHLLDRPASSVTRVEIQIAADKWPSKSSASSAIRYIRPMLAWAEQREYVRAGVGAVKQTQPAKQRHRFLSEDELRRLLPYLAAHAERSPHAAVMLFILWTATRLNEAAGAKWGEFTLGTDPVIWTIPPERVKSTKPTQPDRPHILMLPRQATEFLLARRPEEVSGSALVFPNRDGAQTSNWHDERKAVYAATGTADWTCHDLRRTASTWMGELGTDPHVIEAALNHAAIHSRLASTYNRSRYSPAVGLALQRWADEMDRIRRHQEG